MMGQDPAGMVQNACAIACICVTCICTGSEIGFN